VLKMNSNSGATIITTTNAVNIGSWFRIEGWVYGNATSGQAQLSLYNTMDSTTATETDTSPATENTFGTPQLARFGIGASIATVGPFYMDDLGLSSVGLLGPSLYSGSASAAVTLAVTATGSSQRSGIPSGAVTLAAAAAGSSRRSGTPSGAASLSASAVATRRQSGSVTGAVSLSATAAGQSRRSGSPGAAITIAATAAGQSQRSGVAAAAVLLAVTCTGGVPGPVAAFIAGYPRFRWNAGSPQTRWQSGYPLLRWPAGQ
jgi:hypothetical protein